MIVVAILGVLAAIAVPAFQSYVRRSRASEATELLRQIFMKAAAYYHPDRANKGLVAPQWNACVVGSTDNDVTPGTSKKLGDYTSQSWKSLHHTISYSYFRFEIETVGGARCDVPAQTGPLYLIRARADLDGDGARSSFELATGSDTDNFLYHSRGFYIVDGEE